MSAATEVSIANELLARLVDIERRLDGLTQPDTSAADASAAATATALTDFGARLATLERTLAHTASAADLAREQRLEHLAQTYSAALQAVVDVAPNANLRTIVRDHLGRATGLVDHHPSAPTP